MLQLTLPTFSTIMLATTPAVSQTNIKWIVEGRKFHLYKIIFTQELNEDDGSNKKITV